MSFVNHIRTEYYKFHKCYLTAFLPQYYFSYSSFMNTVCRFAVEAGEGGLWDRGLLCIHWQDYRLSLLSFQETVKGWSMPQHPNPARWKHHPNLLYLSIRRSCGAISHSRSLSLEQEFYLSHWTQQSAAAAYINILVAPVEELRANCPFLSIEHLLTHAFLSLILSPLFLSHLPSLSSISYRPLFTGPTLFCPSSFFSFSPSFYSYQKTLTQSILIGLFCV